MRVKITWWRIIQAMILMCIYRVIRWIRGDDSQKQKRGNTYPLF
jgi:hypothetical protein